MPAMPPLLMPSKQSNWWQMKQLNYCCLIFRQPFPKLHIKPGENMSNIAIVYHSGYGHTAAQAQAVVRGVEKVPGATVTLLTSDEAQQQWEKLEAADAIIFGSP